MASHEPARISNRPAIAPAPIDSPKMVTPSATATTGDTYVITIARPPPIPATRIVNRTSAAALHSTPSTTMEAIAVAVGVDEGGA